MKDQAYWENKHPKVMQFYDGRPLPNGKGMASIDVRCFITDNDAILQRIIDREGLRKDTYDESALAVQQYVVNTLKYVSDETLRCSEYWLFPFETVEMRTGDCEDGGILICSLLHNILPPSEHWRLRVAAGWVQESPTAPEGGHAYCVYIRTTDNSPIALDWCYFEDSKVAVRDKPLIKDVKFYKDVWFSFNRQWAWSHTRFEMSGRVKEIVV